MPPKKATKSSRDQLNAQCRLAVLHGPEEMLQRLYTDTLREALESQLGQVEVVRFEGARVDAADVLDECRSFGLMQQHKLVIVDDADQFVTAATRPALERYAANPSAEATLLLRSRKWNRGNLDAKIKKIGALIKCDELSEPQARAWGAKRCAKAHTMPIDDDAIDTLVMRVGVSMGRLDTELEKLVSVARSRDLSSVTAALVDEMVASTAQEQFWEVQQRLLSGDPATAVQGVRQALGPWRCDPVMVNWSMLDLARKIHTIAALVAQGTNPNEAAKSAALWGASRGPTIDLGCALTPDTAANLLADCAAMDQHFKTGQREPTVWLEVQAIRFASLHHARDDSQRSA